MKKFKHVLFTDWIDKKTPVYVAKVLGVNVSTVSHWRNGHCYPRVEQMRTIKKLTRGAVGYEQIIDGTVGAK